MDHKIRMRCVLATEVYPAVKTQIEWRDSDRLPPRNEELSCQYGRPCARSPPPSTCVRAPKLFRLHQWPPSADEYPSGSQDHVLKQSFWKSRALSEASTNGMIECSLFEVPGQSPALGSMDRNEEHG